MAPYAVRALSIPPGQTREVDTRQYAGCLVLVQGGAIELRCESGAGRRFRDGDMLWLHGLGVRQVTSQSDEQTVLVAISRPSDESDGSSPSNGGRPTEPTEETPR